MTNESLEYRLGRIDANLKNNDTAHREIKEILFGLDNKFDSTNKIINGLCTDIGNLKGKASLWGGITSFIVSAIMGIIGWFVVHLSTK